MNKISVFLGITVIVLLSVLIFSGGDSPKINVGGIYPSVHDSGSITTATSAVGINLATSTATTTTWDEFMIFNNRGPGWISIFFGTATPTFSTSSERGYVLSPGESWIMQKYDYLVRGEFWTKASSTNPAASSTLYMMYK